MHKTSSDHVGIRTLLIGKLQVVVSDAVDTRVQALVVLGGLVQSAILRATQSEIDALVVSEVVQAILTVGVAQDTERGVDLVVDRSRLACTDEMVVSISLGFLIVLRERVVSLRESLNCLPDTRLLQIMEGDGRIIVQISVVHLVCCMKRGRMD